MAELVACFCCSHAPTLAKIYAERPQSAKRVLDIYEEVGARVRNYGADLLVVVYNDHLDNFFLNAFPTFAMGIDDSFKVADEGRGGYWKGEARGDFIIGTRILGSLVEQGFDLTACYGEMVLDHGALVPLLMSGLIDLPVIPLSVNCVVPPIPQASRCWDLGAAIRHSVEALDTNRRCAVLATGGLSHQLSGPKFGVIAEEFDRGILELIVSQEREKLAEMTSWELLRGGEGGLEVLNWIVAAGAAGETADGEVLLYDTTSALMTGMGVVELKIPPR